MRTVKYLFAPLHHSRLSVLLLVGLLLKEGSVLPHVGIPPWSAGALKSSPKSQERWEKIENSLTYIHKKNY